MFKLPRLLSPLEQTLTTLEEYCGFSFEEFYVLNPTIFYYTYLRILLVSEENIESFLKFAPYI